MNMPTFLLMLVGKHETQLKEQQRFEESMKELDKRDEELDELLVGIGEVNQAVQGKNRALRTVMESVRPPKNEQQQQPEEPRVVPVEEAVSG